MYWHTRCSVRCGDTPILYQFALSFWFQTVSMQASTVSRLKDASIHMCVDAHVWKKIMYPYKCSVPLTQAPPTLGTESYLGLTHVSSALTL